MHSNIMHLILVIKIAEDLYEWSKSYLSANPAIIGVLVGFILSQLAIFTRDWAINRKKEKSVRNILELEISHNLILLNTFRNKVKLANRNKLILDSFPFSNWQHKVLESCLLEIPNVLNSERILEVFAFYKDLGVLTDSYSILLELKSASEAAIKDGNEASHSEGDWKTLKAQEKWSEEKRIRNKFLAEWEDFEKFMDKLLENGNPLSKFKNLRELTYKVGMCRVAQASNSVGAE
ncbi:MAG: hypothetical protein DCF22_02305 [Leptolyngbya sp.]|nr:MAG: hypothetical protein DCF22_02305 [Leptolyngbya sp.]